MIIYVFVKKLFPFTAKVNGGNIYSQYVFLNYREKIDIDLYVILNFGGLHMFKKDMGNLFGGNMSC
jgi:hypothetical protein